MKNLNLKKLSALVIAVLLTCTFAVNTFAAVPYVGYTYTQWYGEAVASPVAYVPSKTIDGEAMGIGKLAKPADMFVQRSTGNFYIVDTENNRIVVTNSSLKVLKVIDKFTLDGVDSPLKKPAGIFVDEKGLMYIADKENGRVIKANNQGVILSVYGRPVSEVFPDNIDYKPEKVVVDSQGRLYIQAFGVFQGIICIDDKDNFLSFFGANRVEVTAQVLMDYMWKNIMSYEQRKGMASFVPIEYANLYIDDEDFVYACVKQSTNSTGEIKKLNSKGDNVLRLSPYSSMTYPKNDYGDHPVQWLDNGTRKDTVFADIHLDEEGLIVALDSARCRVFVYDDESNFLFSFGGLGEQIGTFYLPAAVETVGNRVYVLDTEKASITEFVPTTFGENVREAVGLYSDGYYEEAKEPWEKVIRANSNYNLAYTGLGRALMKQENYREAMDVFKEGYDKQGYSDAQMEWYQQLAEDYFDIIAIVILAAIFLPKIVKFILRKVREAKGGAN